MISTTAYYGALLGAENGWSVQHGLDDRPKGRSVHRFKLERHRTAGNISGSSNRHNRCRRPQTNSYHDANFYAKTVANNFEGTGTFSEVPVIQFDNDECSSVLDFFERTDLRRSDGSSNLNAAPEVQGIGISTKAIKQETLINNTSSATTINEFPALAGKSIVIKYKIARGTLDRIR